MPSILYLCAHNPYPPRSGGQVDIWNRLEALQRLGAEIDLVLTTRRPLSTEQHAALSAVAHRLLVVPRTPLPLALLSRKPVQVAARAALRSIVLPRGHYDLALLDNEFTGEILDNPLLHADCVAIRVHNDESAYQRRLATTAANPLLRLYFEMESRRFRSYVPRIWQRADSLWFISSDELKKAETARGRFLPAGLDLSKAGRPVLRSRDVLFVGSLAVALNQDAIRWYLANVHPSLLDLEGYQFVVAGSTLGHDLTSLCREITSHLRVQLHCDLAELGPLFAQSAAFCSPMRFGAGVKLKTVEAALRGLPLVTTTVGAEGSGLLDDVHCRIADEATAFATALRDVLCDKPGAIAMRDRAQRFICEHYNQQTSLRAALYKLGVPG